MKTLEPGISNSKTIVVSEAHSAKQVGSGLLDVFSTPSMIALMEATSYESVSSYLDAGSGTVGISISVKHVAATPIGMKVTCESNLIKVNGRILTFSVKAYDESGLIGEGEHERCIVFNERFQQKADAKKESVLHPAVLC